VRICENRGYALGRAAVVGLNVEGSKARIPHDLGIHGRLFAIGNLAGSFEGFGDRSG